MAKGETKFLEYYNSYKDKIFNYFWYRVNFNRSLAEDLTSEVFIKALASFDRFDVNGSFQAWIYTIARNHFINYCRTAYRETDLENAGNLKTDYLKNIEDSLELEAVIIEINKLDKYCREVLLYKFVDGLDNKEIACLLNKEEGAVRTQISRALAQLREKIKYD